MWHWRPFVKNTSQVNYNFNIISSNNGKENQQVQKKKSSTFNKLNIIMLNFIYDYQVFFYQILNKYSMLNFSKIIKYFDSKLIT
jgi:hypothetical protein